jgi:hypothetical protein
MRCVQIVNGSEAGESLAIVDERGPEAAVSQFYKPGMYPVSEDLSGSADERFASQERPAFVVSYNLELNYIALT